MAKHRYRPVSSYRKDDYWQSWWRRIALMIGFLGALLLLVLFESKHPVIRNLQLQTQHGFMQLVTYLRSPAEGVRVVHDEISTFFRHRLRANEYQQKNHALQQQLRQMEQLREENQHLRELLAVTTHEPAIIATARLYSNAANPYQRVYTLSAGRKQGVAERMAVVHQDRYVGRIATVQDFFSSLLPLTDINARIAVKTALGGEDAMVKGTGSSVLELHYLPKDSSVAQGERLYSSGEAGVVPAGLWVGTVKQVTHDRITVNPAAELQNLHFVQVWAHEGTGDE